MTLPAMARAIEITGLSAQEGMARMMIDAKWRSQIIRRLPMPGRFRWRTAGEYTVRRNSLSLAITLLCRRTFA